MLVNYLQGKTGGLTVSQDCNGCGSSHSRGLWLRHIPHSWLHNEHSLPHPFGPVHFWSWHTASSAMTHRTEFMIVLQHCWQRYNCKPKKFETLLCGVFSLLLIITNHIATWIDLFHTPTHMPWEEVVVWAVLRWLTEGGWRMRPRTWVRWLNGWYSAMTKFWFAFFMTLWIPPLSV